MKGQLKKSAAFAAAALLSVGSALNSSAFGSVTDKVTPVDKNDTALYWATNTSTGWTDAPGVPLVLDDKIVYTSAKNLCAVDKQTGEPLELKGEMAAASSYGICAPIYAEGKIIVSLGGGIIQAFDADTFKSLWIYKDELGGQSNSELTYSDGYVYTGFWNSETKDANFVCVPVEDFDESTPDEEQQAAWTYTSAGGFYWAGAYISDGRVVTGTDNGDSTGDGEGSSIIVFDEAASIESGSAVALSEADTLGDIRSGIGYDESTGYYFATSKAKLIYRFKIDNDGNITDLSSLELSGQSTSTPVAANGRVYIGVSGSSAYSEYSGHHIAVIDVDSFKTVYTLKTNGYCQSSALISERDGENYVYFTANYIPGKVYAFHDNASMTEPEKTETVTVSGSEIEGCCPTLFTPVGEQSNYCLTGLSADEDGTLYFKNDSGYIMALGSRVDSITVEGKTIYKEGELFDTESLKITAAFADGRTKDVTKSAEYDLSEPLTVDDDEISVSYDGMLYGDTDTETGHEYGELYGTLEITVLAETDFNAVMDCIAAIDEIGEVTADSGELILAAETLYDALPDEHKQFVENADKLTAAREAYDEIINDDSSSEEDSSAADDSSEAEDSSSELDSDESDSSSESTSDSTASSSSSSSSASGNNSSGAVSSSSSAAGSTSSSASSSSSNTASSTSSTAAPITKNPATGTAGAVSLGLLIFGAVLTVSRKSK
ncbi:MAG: PQQ-binding-like beta-propeller repeat protein [Oscillospiraceae bacterium]